jgi:ketosteroid isomerase-like protein
MSRENVDSVRRGLEAFRRGGVEALLDFIDPEFETTTPAELSVEPSTYRGHDGLRRYFESFYEIMEEIRFEAEEFVDAGERVVVPTRLIARGRGTGIDTEQRLTMVWTVRGGKAVRLDSYGTKAEALAAAGLARSS